MLTSPHEVARFVPEVQTHADAERDALGFLASQAYEIAARKGTLYIAVETAADGKRYAGHLLFGDTYPHAKVFQAFVVSDARKFGVGRKLIETLVKFVEGKQYLSVSAKVAEGLAANTFYQSLGFDTLRTKPGGASRGRTINVRVKQLNTPALFGYREPVSGLPLAEPLPNFTPVFALDLNIFFDVTKRRPRSEFGGAVMSASFDNLVRLAVTEEFGKELRRSSQGASDPTLEFALQLPTLSSPPGGIEQRVLDELAELVFSNRAALGTLSTQDKSDLLHIGIAAHHKVTGFVTAEDALVEASSVVEERFGIRIIHVRDLAESLKNTTHASSPLEIGFAEADLRMSESAASSEASVAKLVTLLTLPTDVRGLILASGIHATNRRSLSITFENEIVCAAFWRPQSALQGTLDAVIISDEDQASLEVAVDALLNRLSRVASSSGPVRLHLSVPNACLTVQQMAIRRGFTRCSDASTEISRFQRLSVGTTVSGSSWPSLRKELRQVADMTFPEILPPIAGDDLRIPFENNEGKEYQIDLYDLETALSPTIFLLHGRSGVLVPIQAGYADQLLGTWVQASLFPRYQAVELHERIYFSAPRNANILRRGMPIVFTNRALLTGVLLQSQLPA